MAAFLNCLFHGCYTIPTSLITWLRSCRGNGSSSSKNGHSIPAPEYDDDRDISESIPLEAAAAEAPKTNGRERVVAKDAGDGGDDIQLEEEVDDSNALQRWWNQSTVRAAMSKMMPSSPRAGYTTRHAEDLGLIDLDDDDEEEEDEDVENSR